MRERSTWNRDEIKKQASMAKKADPYTLNQEHPQPDFDKYNIGDSSDFAEDVHTPNRWEKEYNSDGTVKRNELGMPEFLDNTWNHQEKTASQEVLLKKANLCVAVADLMLSGKRVASATAIEDQAVALMYLPDSELIATHARLAADEQDDDSDDDDDDQEKTAGDDEEKKFPKELFEKRPSDEKDQSKEATDGDVDKKEDGDNTSHNYDYLEDKSDLPDHLKGDINQTLQNEQAKLAGSDQLASKVAEMAQQMAQLQKMLAGQQQAQGGQLFDQGQDIDQLLIQDDGLNEGDIQMDAFPMDDVGMGQEDEILRNLFADDQSEETEEKKDEDQNKQAAVRTASTRTVGTRPSAGVANLGGSAKTASSKEAANLSSLWASAPDVRSAFGIK